MENNIIIKDKYELVVNYKEGFDEEQFLKKVKCEVYTKYDYILADISQKGEARLTGFYEDENNSASYKRINEFLIDHCAFGCAYYIVKIIK